MKLLITYIVLFSLSAWSQRAAQEENIARNVDLIRNLFHGFESGTATDEEKARLRADSVRASTLFQMSHEDLFVLGISYAQPRRNSADDELLVLLGTVLSLESSTDAVKQDRVFDLRTIEQVLKSESGALKGQIRDYITALVRGRNIQDARNFMGANLFNSSQSSPDLLTIEGEYFKNTGRVFGDYARDLVSRVPRDAADAALKLCQEKGYEHRTAFYFERQGSNWVVSDVFCSHQPTRDNTNARAIIMRSRKARGLALAPNANEVMRSVRDTHYRGFKQTDLANPQVAPQRATVPTRGQG